MAKMKRLSPEELEQMRRRNQPSERTLKRRQEYEKIRNFLASIPPGEGGVIELEEGDKRITIRNRLKKAAKELGVELEFIRRRKMIVFQVMKKETDE